MRKILFLPLMLLVCMMSIPLGWGADWLTDGHDPQRTGWQKDEKILSVANVSKLKLLWKYQTGNESRQMHSLFPPLIVSQATVKGAPREVAILAGVSDNIYAIDAQNGELIWKKHFESAFQAPPGGRGGGILCPGGQTATPVIGPANTPGKYTVYAVSWDGMLHQLNVGDGEDVAPPQKFMPPNGKPYALNLVNGVIYTMTAQQCGGNPNYFYAFDLSTSVATMYSPGGAGMWGTRGPAAGTDGTVYTGTGDGVWNPALKVYGNGLIGVKHDPKTDDLTLSKYYAPPNVMWMFKRDLDVETTPTIFTYKGKEYLAGSSKECRMWLLDTSDFGGADHQTAVYRTPQYCNEFYNYGDAGVWGALSNWVDSKGTQWVVSPFWGPKHPQFHAAVENGEITHGAVVAFKVETINGKIQLTPAWISEDMNRADPPVIANGIVFGYGSGEDTTQARGDTPVGVTAPEAQSRIEASTHAVLYALDGQTGKTLWSSGNQITSWNHYSGLTVANGRVYIGTWDGTEYCFGLSK
ncbi:MAG TPA: PQQ-binding-like beta-propeller repeat protein [Bryobacteraceae bacterium]|nr:PQQ-binding-like beta-propeller repeat protein [Bryobacteraceae bacterium]HWB95772.1 PQQ-binding-like beta-propeller repeat protein [Bryobacteraceae bacterium]